MTTTKTYLINKGINKSVEFKGLRAQYIWYAGGGVMCLMVVYALLYLIGINSYLSVVVVLIAGALLMQKIYSMNAKYGEYGLMKVLAKKGIPRVVKLNSREVFMNLRKARNGKANL